MKTSIANEVNLMDMAILMDNASRSGWILNRKISPSVVWAIHENGSQIRIDSEEELVGWLKSIPIHPNVEEESFMTSQEHRQYLFKELDRIFKKHFGITEADYIDNGNELYKMKTRRYIDGKETLLFSAVCDTSAEDVWKFDLYFRTNPVPRNPSSFYNELTALNHVFEILILDGNGYSSHKSGRKVSRVRICNGGIGILPLG